MSAATKLLQNTIRGLAIENERLVERENKLLNENAGFQHQNADLMQEIADLKMQAAQAQQSTPHSSQESYNSQGVDPSRVMSGDSSSMERPIPRRQLHQLKKSIEEAFKNGNGQHATNANVSLPEWSMTLQEAHDHINRLVKENLYLKSQLDLQEPLVKVAVAIRRGFLHQVRDQAGLGKSHGFLIQAGNQSANDGDIEADAALIALGYGGETEAEVANYLYNTADIEDYNPIVHNMIETEMEIREAIATLKTICPGCCDGGACKFVGKTTVPHFSFWRLANFSLETTQALTPQSLATEGHQKIGPGSTVQNTLNVMRQCVDESLACMGEEAKIWIRGAFAKDVDDEAD